MRLGAVHVESEHPIKTLHREGVTVTINSDDPSLVNTTLSDEIGLLSSHFGLSLIEIDAILENGIEVLLSSTSRSLAPSPFTSATSVLIPKMSRSPSPNTVTTLSCWRARSTAPAKKPGLK